ncbi:hypothetical protein K0U83_02690 [bacterium]|nr:hypothetical protein [bacterium]
MFKYVVFGMMMQAATGGALSRLGWITLSTGQQLAAAVVYMSLLVGLVALRTVKQ